MQSSGGWYLLRRLPQQSGVRKPPAISCAPTGVVWLRIAPKRPHVSEIATLECDRQLLRCLLIACSHARHKHRGADESRIKAVGVISRYKKHASRTGYSSGSIG